MLVLMSDDAGGRDEAVVDDPIAVGWVLALTLSAMAVASASLLASPCMIAWIASWLMMSCWFEVCSILNTK